MVRSPSGVGSGEAFDSLCFQLLVAELRPVVGQFVAGVVESFPDARRPGDLRLVGREAGTAFALIGEEEGFGALEWGERWLLPADREDSSGGSCERRLRKPGEAVPVMDGARLIVPPAHV